MNVRQLSRLSKFLIFFLPIIITLLFLVGGGMQLRESFNKANSIKKVDENIDYINSLDNAAFMEMENERALETFLIKELGYSTLLFDRFWLYKLLIIKESGEVIDIEDMVLNMSADDEENSQAPIEYLFEGIEGENYKLLVIELNSFIFNTPKNTSKGENRQFPSRLVDESNGERLRKVDDFMSISDADIRTNHISSKKGYSDDYTSKYAYLLLDFTLNKSFNVLLPLSWSNWWESSMTLSSIAFKKSAS